MDTHIKGPRGALAIGAVVSAMIASVRFGSPPQSGHDIFRTNGATLETPVAVRITPVVTTEFDAAGAEVKIVSSKLDGSDDQDVVASDGDPTTIVLTEDRIFQGYYTVGTGGTEGDVSFILETFGKGIPEVNL